MVMQTDVAIASLSAEEQTARLTSICRGSREDADMDINKQKTINMVVQRQPEIALPTAEEILDVESKYKNECQFCGRKFKTPRGLNIHLASCSYQHGLTDDEFEIENINATFGTPEHRWYRVEWTGHPGEDSWMPWRSLVQQGCEESIKDFWLKSKKKPQRGFHRRPG